MASCNDYQLKLRTTQTFNSGIYNIERMALYVRLECYCNPEVCETLPEYLFADKAALISFYPLSLSGNVEIFIKVLEKHQPSMRQHSFRILSSLLSALIRTHQIRFDSGRELDWARQVLSFNLNPVMRGL